MAVKKYKYQAVITAQKGHLLLGGLPVTRSSWFDRRKDAQRLLEVSCEINRDAGRKIGNAKVISREVKPSKAKKKGR